MGFRPFSINWSGVAFAVASTCNNALQFMGILCVCAFFPLSFATFNPKHSNSIGCSWCGWSGVDRGCILLEKKNIYIFAFHILIGFCCGYIHGASMTNKRKWKAHPAYRTRTIMLRIWAYYMNLQKTPKCTIKQVIKMFWIMSFISTMCHCSGNSIPACGTIVIAEQPKQTGIPWIPYFEIFRCVSEMMAFI